jgi:beta-glucosidase/6-phospho-beta-glucosidase/beta-galactosidase
VIPKGAVWNAVSWWASEADTDREGQALSQLKLQWVRADVGWAALEPDQKGQISSYALSLYDRVIDRAAAAGVKVLMPIVEVPYWASADPKKYTDSSGKKHWNNNYKPKLWDDYGAICEVVARHFAAKGVHTYEIWNEPNNSRFWPSGVSASDYAGMLKAGYQGVKRGDPTATVFCGGLMYNDYDYLANVYRAGGRGYMDGVSVHPYAVKPYPYFVSPTASWKRSDGKLDPHCFPALDEVRKTMNAWKESAKPIWLTEVGWPTTATPGGVSEAVQAQYLTSAFSFVNARSTYLKAAFWYSLRDLTDADSGPESRFGLLRRDFSQKPAFASLAAA